MSNTIAVVAGISGEVIANELKKRNYGVAIIGGKENESGMDIADYVLVSDLDNHEKIYNFLTEHGIDKVIFGTGHIKAFFLAEYLCSKHIKASIDPQVSLIAKDKFLYKESLIENGFTTPNQVIFRKDEAFSLDKVQGSIELPCVIKSTTDACYPQKVKHISEVEKAVLEIQNLGTDVLIEEFIEGVDLTVPFISNYKDVKAVMVSYYSKAKECKLKGFDSFCDMKLDSETEAEILKYSEDVVKKTKVIGVGRLDIIVRNNKFYVLECNSVMVTGIHPNQIEYGLEFLKKENVDFPSMLVENAIEIFNQIQ